MCSDKIHQGGGVAAPVGGQIFSEILPYLEVNQGNEEEVEKAELVEVPDITGKTVSEAEKILKENSLEIDKDNTAIKEQTPKAGITVNKGSKIYIKIL